MSLNRAESPLLAASLIALFATLWVIIEALGATAGVPAQEVVFVRYGVHLLFVVAVYGPQYGSRLYRTSRLALQVGRSLMMLIMPISFLAAISRIPVTTLLSLFWLAPLLAMLLGRREITRRHWLAGAVGYAGVLLIEGFHGPINPAGTLFSVTMAASFALYQHMTRKLADHLEVTNLFHTALWVFLALIGPVVLTWRTPTATGWAALAGIGLLGFAALYALDAAIRRVAPAAIAAALFVQPFLAMLFDAARGSAQISAAGFLGAILIAIALAATVRRAAALEEAVAV
jgi:drug/metabolite transporter (DMT)-like permease